MTDLIEKREAISRITKQYVETNGGEDRYAVGINVGITKALNALQDMRPAEEEPGRWIPIREDGWYGRCSKCGTVTDYNFPYCPYCGEKMAEEKNVRG